MRAVWAAALLTLLLVECTSVRADTWLTVTVRSEHFSESSTPRNEDNFGIGFEHDLAPSWRLVGGGYRNSEYNDSYYGGVAWMPVNMGLFKLGLVGGIITGYSEMDPAPLLAPVLALEGRHFGANLIVVPPVKDVGAIALQLKWRFR